MAKSQNKINKDMNNNMFDIHMVTLKDYTNLVEELRVRLNILSTSVFLLKDSFNGNNSPNQNRYFDKINAEMLKIKSLISNHPNEVNLKQSPNK